MAYSTLINTYSSPLPTLYKIQVLKSVPQLSLASFSSWNGLKSNGVSFSLKSLKFEKKRKSGRKGVYASLFGVGAPEALVVGVVALLVFGPKGLAEIAKNLGKTLRTFQPTIRELQEVSREFKSTLEQEIGLDELKNPSQLKTATIPNLSSTPLSVATPEKTSSIPTTAATTEVPQATTAPLAAANDDSLPATPAAMSEDSEVVATTPAAMSEDSQVVATTPAAMTMSEDSQVVATTPAAMSEDSQVAATTPAVTTTIDPSSVQDVAVSSEVGTGV